MFVAFADLFAPRLRTVGDYRLLEAAVVSCFLDAGQLQTTLAVLDGRRNDALAAGQREWADRLGDLAELVMCQLEDHEARARQR